MRRLVGFMGFYYKVKSIVKEEAKMLESLLKPETERVKWNSSFYKSHLKCNARKLFNQLPEALKNLKTYKKKLKTLLIQKSYHNINKHLSDMF